MRTLTDVEAALAPFVERAGQLTGSDITTVRTLHLSEHVGSPHERLKVIHVAGTSGKTSTSYYVRELLEAAGQKTGLTVSPHMVRITDRVQVGGGALSDQLFCAYLDEFLELVKSAPEQPTYFEVLIVFALWVFDREKVDYAVLETGLGGLHDSTNICRRPDKVCVLTDIGFDHINVLGTTLSQIAAQKSGIIAPHNHAILYKQNMEIMNAVKQATISMHVTIEFATIRSVVASQPWLADYQQRNWSLAYATYRHVASRDKLPVLRQSELAETMEAIVPGRIEIFNVKDTTIVLDGAHNEQKMRTFWKSFEHKFPDIKPTVVLGMKQGKEIETVAPIVEKYAMDVIATMATNTQDTPIAAMDVSDISRACIRKVCMVKNPIQALLKAIDDGGVVVVTGSLYLVAEIRAYLKANML